MKPYFRLAVGGREVDFRSKLKSCEITDKEGVSSDTINFVISNEDQSMSLPRKGVEIEAYARGTGPEVFMGKFKAETVTATCFPHNIEVTGKAAGFQGEEKQTKERHWDNSNVSKIVTDIAEGLGLQAAVDPQVGSHTYTWIGQDNESPLAFLERLAKRHDALFSIKNGLVVFAARGAGVSPFGSALTGGVITPERVVVGTCRFDFSDRTKYKRVLARFPDRAQGVKIEIEVESDGAGVSDFRISEQFADEAEARKAATAKAKDLKRRQAKFAVEVVGDPTIRAGAPVSFSGFLPEIDGQSFIVETAVHSLSKGSGFRTRLNGHIQVASKTSGTNSTLPSETPLQEQGESSDTTVLPAQTSPAPSSVGEVRFNSDGSIYRSKPTGS